MSLILKNKTFNNVLLPITEILGSCLNHCRPLTTRKSGERVHFGHTNPNLWRQILAYVLYCTKLLNWSWSPFLVKTIDLEWNPNPLTWWTAQPSHIYFTNIIFYRSPSLVLCFTQREIFSIYKCPILPISLFFCLEHLLCSPSKLLFAFQAQLKYQLFLEVFEDITTLFPTHANFHSQWTVLFTPLSLQSCYPSTFHTPHKEPSSRSLFAYTLSSVLDCKFINLFFLVLNEYSTIL